MPNPNEFTMTFSAVVEAEVTHADGTTDADDDNTDTQED